MMVWPTETCPSPPTTTVLPRLTLRIVVPRYCSNGVSGVAASRLGIVRTATVEFNRRSVCARARARRRPACGVGVIARWVSCDDANGPTITRCRVAPLDSVTVAVSVFQPDCASVARKRSASSLFVNDPACNRNSCGPSRDRRVRSPCSVGSGRDEIFSFGRRSKNSNRVTGVESLATGAGADRGGRLPPHHSGSSAPASVNAMPSAMPAPKLPQWKCRLALARAVCVDRYAAHVCVRSRSVRKILRHRMPARTAC